MKLFQKADPGSNPLSQNSEARVLVKKALRRQGYALALELMEELERENAGLAARIAELEDRNARLQNTLWRVRGWIQDSCGDICDHIRSVFNEVPVAELPAGDETAAV